MADSPATRYATPRQLFAWATFDWAATPFFVVVITFIFAAYFTQAVAANPVDGTAQWGWAMTIAALIIGVLAPIFGAVADAGGRRKPWLRRLRAHRRCRHGGLVGDHAPRRASCCWR